MNDSIKDNNKDANELCLIDMDKLKDGAKCLKIVAHPMRLRIVNILQDGAKTVAEISAICGLNQPRTSEHLRLLRNCDLVNAEYKGRQVYYSIKNRMLNNLMECIGNKHCE